MKSEKLATRLGKLVEKEIRYGSRVLLVYGDCCMGMAALIDQPGVVFVPAATTVAICSSEV